MTTPNPAGGHEQAAIDQLLERHLPALRAFIRLRTNQAIRERESQSDIVQSVCREILSGQERFQYQGEPAFKGWLFTTALRKIVEKDRHWRSLKRDVAREVRAPEDGAAGDGNGILAQYATFMTPSREAALNEQLQAVEAAMDQLSEEQREVLTMARVAGLSHAEIAAQTGRTEQASRQILRRAVVKLAEILDHPGTH